MSEQMLQASITPSKKFVVVCPDCNQTKHFPLEDLSPSTPNPFPYECSCGKSYQVMLNFRKSVRKKVNLFGTFILIADPKNIPRTCNVLDISSTGMRLGTDLIKTLQKGDELNVAVILDDKRRTKLEIRAAVRQIIPDKARLILGIVYVSVTPFQKQILGFYLL